MKQTTYLIVLFLCASIASSFEVTYQEYYQQHWQRWKSLYGKTYGSETEEDERFAVWNGNLRVIVPYLIDLSITLFNRELQLKPTPVLS